MDTNEFIEKAKKIHGDKYDYSKVNYVNSQTKVCIICPIHGEFWQLPTKHLYRKQGCKKCATAICGLERQYTTEQFIEKAKKIHGDKYDYSKVNYVNAKTLIRIICPIHGEFWQLPSNHLQGGGCKKCASDETSVRCKKKIDKFITEAKVIHGDKYNYSKVECSKFY